MDKWSHHQHLKQSNSFQALYSVPYTKSKEDRLRRHLLREHDNRDWGANLLLSGSVFAAAFENLGFLQVSQFPIFIILGMAGYFGAVSKAPLTAMILVTEMVGNLHQLMTIGVVTLIAYLVMDFMGGEPVYEAMLHNLIAHEPKQVDNIPTMIDLPVTDSLAGRLVKDLTLPDGVLISTQIFQDQSEVVHGDTRLKAGATLYLVVNESNISQVRKLFL